MPIKHRYDTYGLRAERIDYRPNAVYLRTPLGFVGYRSIYRLTWFQKLVHWIQSFK